MKFITALALACITSSAAHAQQPATQRPRLGDTVNTATPEDAILKA